MQIVVKNLWKGQSYLHAALTSRRVLKLVDYWTTIAKKEMENECELCKIFLTVNTFQ